MILAVQYFPNSNQFLLLNLLKLCHSAAVIFQIFFFLAAPLPH